MNIHAPFGPAICHGSVVHRRISPVDHRLEYKVFSLLLDIDRLEEAAGDLALFSLDRFNLYSLNQRDHGYRDGRPISQFVWDTVQKAGLEGSVERVLMLVYPRLLGYAFNPLTVYFCLDPKGIPRLMIYEVRNTFGEHLTYAVPAEAADDGSVSQIVEKRFYVSPFNTVSGNYHFNVRLIADNVIVGVALKGGDSGDLRTHFAATNHPLTDRALLAATFRYPLMALKVVAGIHWEALKLYFKGLRLKPRPPVPDPWLVVEEPDYRRVSRRVMRK